MEWPKLLYGKGSKVPAGSFYWRVILAFAAGSILADVDEVRAFLAFIGTTTSIIFIGVILFAKSRWDIGGDS